MASKEENSTVVERFANIGIEDTPENLTSVRNTIMQVCEAYPDKFFTQRDFRDNLSDLEHGDKTGYSNPYINNVLKKLVGENMLERVKNGRTSYYKWSGQ